MNSYVLVACVVCSIILGCNGSPLVNFEIEQQALIQPKNYDLLLNLLPLYGGIKLKNLITERTYEKLYKVVKKNPEIYYDFKKNLDPIGIIMPQIENINWDVFNGDDWKLIEDIVKDTPIRDAINDEYVVYLENYFENNPAARQQLINKAIQAGIIISDNLDNDAVGEALGNAFVPNISKFVPTIVNCAVFASVWG